MNKKTNQLDENGRIIGRYRTFKHANSQRKLNNRAKDDEKEARQYTTSVDLNTNQESAIKRPFNNTWTPNDGKYPVKPKRPGDKKETIRKLKGEEEMIIKPEDLRLSACIIGEYKDKLYFKVSKETVEKVYKKLGETPCKKT